MDKNKKIKLSGYEFKKKREEKEKRHGKDKDSLLKFLFNPTAPIRNEHDMNIQPSTSNSFAIKVAVNNAVQPASHENFVIEKMNLDLEQDYGRNTFSDVVITDPGTWPKMNDKLRQMIIKTKLGHIKNHAFPTDKNNRKFTKFHYQRKLCNGEMMTRKWLQYSLDKDRVFCICCKLFPSTASNSSLNGSGSNDWKNLVAQLSMHERNAKHVECFQLWRELEMSLITGRTIDQAQLAIIKEKENYWQNILERLIDLVRVLGEQNLPFRGSGVEQLNCPRNGNFLKFIQFLGRFDPIMKEHLRKITSNEIHVHYLGKNIQNELMHVLFEAINKKIIEHVHQAKYYSIILDCTPDASHVEQMTMIVRFVDMEKLQQSEVFIREHFLGFVPIKSSTGEFLAETLIKQLEHFSLDVQMLRGQGYDNGSNMKGKDKGVQKRILDLNPRAFFVPCNAHSLNLVVNYASKSCVCAVKNFDLVQHVFVFFSSSTKRWEVIKKHVNVLNLKPLSNTRWESRIDALTALRFELGHTYDALMEIYDDISYNGTTGTSIRAEAQGIATRISNYKFIVQLVTWHNILFEINITSKMLQNKMLNINSALQQLNHTRKYLHNLRTDSSFNSLLVDCVELAKANDFPYEFVSEPLSTRRKKKLFAYEGADDPIIDPCQKFKIEFYFTILDAAINSIEERFQQMEHLESVFGVIYNMKDVKNEKSEVTVKACMKLEAALRHVDLKDIDGNDLFIELKSLCTHFESDLSITPQEALKYICEKQLTDCYPNVFIALRILLTLPVSVASAERSFSKLKLIKSYIRTTMTEDRLNALATLSIEQEISNSLDISNLVKDFAKMKARKVDF